jgi:hypothetical protein
MPMDGRPRLASRLAGACGEIPAPVKVASAGNHAAGRSGPDRSLPYLSAPHGHLTVPGTTSASPSGNATTTPTARGEFRRWKHLLRGVRWIPRRFSPVMNLTWSVVDLGGDRGEVGRIVVISMPLGRCRGEEPLPIPSRVMSQLVGVPYAAASSSRRPLRASYRPVTRPSGSRWAPNSTSTSPAHTRPDGRSMSSVATRGRELSIGGFSLSSYSTATGMRLGSSVRST